ncbi:hypothetical protein BS78_02G016000 [Paspalum vaginatum]|nr:hypothetical protein BS78_02G016000 [Paspalum vaginatum]
MTAPSGSAWHGSDCLRGKTSNVPATTASEERLGRGPAGTAPWIGARSACLLLWTRWSWRGRGEAARSPLGWRRRRCELERGEAERGRRRRADTWTPRVRCSNGETTIRLY